MSDLEHVIFKMKSQDTKKLKLPDEPGVYLFKAGKGVLYIGKATSLSDRVASYFARDIAEVRSPLIAQMVSEATALKWYETDSVLEALILESKLIREYLPKYNTQEKDNKSFNHVVITEEEFPRVFVVREHDLLNQNISLTKKNKFGLPAKQISLKFEAGPFPSGKSLREALKIIRKIFPFLDEKSRITHNERFYRQIGLVPDIGDAKAKAEYQKTIRNIVLFFEGKKQKLVSLLEKEMKALAKKQEFELAEEKKRQIFALKHIQDVALIKSNFFPRESASSLRLSANRRLEAYDVAHISGTNVVGVMTVVEDGEAKKSGYRKFKIKDAPGVNDTKALREILERRLGHPEWSMPRLIVVDGGKGQKNMAERVLRTYGISIPVIAVTKDEFHRPKKLLGFERGGQFSESDILLANAEAHRFALVYHRGKRRIKFQGQTL